MRNLIPILVLLVSSCSSFTPAQGYGVPSQRYMLTGSKVTHDEYQATDKNDAAGFNTGGDPDVDGWEVQLDWYFNGPTALIGYRQREYGGDVDSTEYFGGGRYFFGGSSRRSGYLIGVVRFSEGLELSGADSDNYWGYGFGGGSLAQMTENLYLDFRITYERLFSDIKLGPDEIELRGVVGSIGIAIVE